MGSFGGDRGYLGVLRVCFVSEMAQAELKWTSVSPFLAAQAMDVRAAHDGVRRDTAGQHHRPHGVRLGVAPAALRRRQQVVAAQVEIESKF